MKKFLLVLPFRPWPLISGGHQAIFNGIAAIKDYAEIYIVYKTNSIEKDKFYNSDLLKELNRQTIHICPYNIPRQKTTMKKRLISFLNKCVLKIDRILGKSANNGNDEDNSFNYLVNTSLNEDEYYGFINRKIKEYSIDLVQTEMIENIDVVLALPEDVKKVFVHHEIRFVRNRLLISNKNSFYRKALVELEKAKEIYCLNKYDRVITLSEIDNKKLECEGVMASISSSFSIVKFSKHSILSDKNYISNKILSFVGPEFHAPNKMGLMWFLENCWQILRDEGYKLQIIGDWSKYTIEDWNKQYDGIEFLGFVNSLSDAINNTVMIVPIMVGSGIRMKILEAMGSCVPFVSTSIGAEGIPIQHNINGFIADTPDDFINCIKTLNDSLTRTRIVKEAYNLVNKYYSIEALSKNRITIYDNLFQER